VAKEKMGSTAPLPPTNVEEPLILGPTAPAPYVQPGTGVPVQSSGVYPDVINNPYPLDPMDL
jgi:hypothetical protein